MDIIKIGIHSSKGSFSERWIDYCEQKNISWKLVNCYQNDIIEQLDDCDVLMWHINQGNPKDNLFAKQLIHAVESSGIRVFPNIHTSWHFDDKVGQKYLLESIGAPLVPTWVFYEKKDAFNWIENTSFPKVFKLRGGAGSKNVSLVRNRNQAKNLARKSFGRGIRVYNPWESLKERWRKFKLGKTDLKDVFKGIFRIFVSPAYAKVNGRERGYIYFQEFLPQNSFDIRIIVIGDKAFAIKRMVRKNDFRASGSGEVLYGVEHFFAKDVELSFKMAQSLKSQSAAFDFIYHDSKTYVVEVSFGFIKEVYDPCEGYWDEDLKWHPGSFNPSVWMVDNIIREIELGKSSPNGEN